jgi:hypothetical protein
MRLHHQLGGDLARADHQRLDADQRRRAEVEDFAGAFELGGIDFNASSRFFRFSTDGHGFSELLHNGLRSEA